MRQLFDYLHGSTYFSESERFWIGLIYFVLFLILFALIVLGVYLLIYKIIDKNRSYQEVKAGVIVDKIYVASSTSSGSGTAIMPSANGGIGVGVISTSSTTPEQFLLFVQCPAIQKIEVSMEQYYKYEVGNTISFINTIGGLSKDILKTDIN